VAATGTKTAREVVTEYFDAIGAQDLDRAVATWEPGSLDRLHGFGDLPAPDGIREYFGGIFKAVPDFRLEVLSMVAEGDDVAVRWRATGKFDGSERFEGLAPNGSAIELEGLDLLTVRDGKIVGNEAYTNGMEFARQVGALPPRGSAAEKAMAAAFNAKTAIQKRLRGG
jgi:predicted ester cyclase